MFAAHRSSPSLPARVLAALSVVGLTTVLAVGLTGGLLVGPAGAHSALIGSDPSDGATVETLPEQVTLEFNESVSTTSTEVVLTGPDGSSVPAEQVRVEGREVLANLPEATENGAHVIAFRIVSADGHPVSGQIGVEVTAAQGATPEASATPEADGQEEQTQAAAAEQESFVHRHGQHLAIGAVVALAAIGLILWPVLRGRRQ